METITALHSAIQSSFPDLSARADERHRRFLDEPDGRIGSLWFECLADALNVDISREVPATVHRPLLNALSRAWVGGKPALRRCIDVAFVENLFWQLPSTKCAPYWQQLPAPLKKLYLDFHGREP